MVAVGNGFVTAAWPVDMVRVMTAAAVRRRASVWIGLRDGDRVLVHMTLMGVVQVTVMEVVDVPFMQDGLVATAWAMDMVVGIVGLAVSHRSIPLLPYLRRSSSTWSNVLVRRSRTWWSAMA